MLAYFIIGIALLIAFIIGGNAIANADPKKLLRAIRVALAILLAGFAAFFAYTGRFHYAPPLAAAAIFLLRRRPFFGQSSPSPGQQSDVKTDWLHAVLDHDSGQMDAKILKGDFQDKMLSDLTLEELKSLLQTLDHDEQSAAILTTFMERNFFEEDTEQHTGSSGRHENRTNTEQQNGMSKTEAYEILELKPGASQKEIKTAHKILMKKFHPDHGGSAYLAAKLNQAKDILLES